MIGEKKKKRSPKPEAPLSSTLWGLSLAAVCAIISFAFKERAGVEAEKKFGKTIDGSSQTNVYMIYSFSLSGGRVLVNGGWYKMAESSWVVWGQIGFLISYIPASVTSDTTFWHLNGWERFLIVVSAVIQPAASQPSQQGLLMIKLRIWSTDWTAVYNIQLAILSSIFSIQHRRKHKSKFQVFFFFKSHLDLLRARNDQLHRLRRYLFQLHIFNTHFHFIWNSYHSSASWLGPPYMLMNERFSNCSMFDTRFRPSIPSPFFNWIT